MELLEHHFDAAFAAQDGIKNLRELILTLAIQGRLVPQNPNDPPARELLKSIEIETKRLVIDGTIKALKPLPSVTSEDIPYVLPRGWEWVRFGSIAVIERGGSPRPIQSFFTEESDGLSWIKIGDTDKGGKYITSTKEKIRRDGLSKTRMVFPGDFLLTNSMSFGRPYITMIEGCIHDGWLRISPPKSLDKDYLYLLLSSSFIRKRFEAAAAGAVVLNLNADKVRELPIPLPSLPEQHRIVSKIDELMARCDELEKLTKERDAKCLAVHEAAMQQLLNVAEPDERQNAFEFLNEHFGELYAVKENVAELRKAILQLAVMGKLLSQRQDDPPASDLLKKIVAQKQTQLKGNKFKKSTIVPEVSKEDEPFPVPRTWQWVRICDIAQSIDYGTSQKTCDDSTLVPVYRMGNIVDGQLVDDGFKYISPALDELPKLYLNPNDILFNRTNSYELVGKSALYSGPDNYATFASYLIRIRPLAKLLCPAYIISAMNAPYFRETQIEPKIVQQCGQANFNGTKLSLCLVPLPPLNEQRRIVARIGQMTSLCDALDRQIDAATKQQGALLDAVMAQMGESQCA